MERLTVYRHFADEADMFQACSVHFANEVVPPDPARWAGVPEPAERLRAALLSFYDYYCRGEPMLANARRDAPALPALAAVLAPFDAFVDEVRDGLLGGWKVKGAARERLAAAIAHALRFETWPSLVRSERLGDAQAVELMIALARGAAAPVRGASRG